MTLLKTAGYFASSANYGPFFVQVLFVISVFKVYNKVLELPLSFFF